MKGLLIVMCAAVLLSACTAQSAPQAQATQELRIGFSTAQTGTGAVFGQAALIGANKAADEINSAGGHVTLIVADNKNDPKEGIIAYRAIAAQQPDILISSLSGATGATIPLAEQDGLFVIQTISYADYTKDHANVFNYYFRPEDETVPTLAAMQTAGVRKVAIIAINTDYGNSLATDFTKRANALGIEVVVDERFAPTDTDNKVSLLKVKNSGATAVFVVALFPDRIYAQAKDMALPQSLYANALPIITGQSREAVFEGQFMTVPVFAQTGSAEAATFANLFGSNASGYAAFGYDTVHLAYAASQTEAGKRGAWQEALSKLGEFDGLIGKTHFSNHGINIPLVVWQKPVEGTN